MPVILDLPARIRCTSFQPRPRTGWRAVWQIDWPASPPPQFSHTASVVLLPRCTMVAPMRFSCAIAIETRLRTRYSWLHLPQGSTLYRWGKQAFPEHCCSHTDLRRTSPAPDQLHFATGRAVFRCRFMPNLPPHSSRIWLRQRNLLPAAQWWHLCGSVVRLRSKTRLLCTRYSWLHLPQGSTLYRWGKASISRNHCCSHMTCAARLTLLLTNFILRPARGSLCLVLPALCYSAAQFSHSLRQRGSSPLQ